ncbi:hypothetical protein IL252_16615 [Halomicrobium sp. IBSBa]|uniref:hypothetical protein n=1 Tax=Halomicrobium sp. IBSBa TaxID=2778916 RepID=UPI001AC00620|nr:hypothetical protein [Halomicrobium sp. IBSBa]MBO4249434.1 hypothetical protein [Halomicrobium sp. IBSBa]
MEDTNQNVTRRRLLASSASVAVAGSLVSGSAVAKKQNRRRSQAEGLETEQLTDAITIANGKAKVKGWARNSEEATLSVAAQGGGSVEYTASEFAEHINLGVENGYWTVNKTGGQLDFDLTDKGRNLVEEHTPVGGPIQLQGCGGKNTIENGVYYFDSNSLDDIMTGIRGSGAVITIAGIIVGALTAATMGPAVFAIAGVLIGFGAGELGQISNGCGIKVDPNASNEVQPQECDC